MDMAQQSRCCHDLQEREAAAGLQPSHPTPQDSRQGRNVQEIFERGSGHHGGLAGVCADGAGMEYGERDQCAIEEEVLVLEKWTRCTFGDRSMGSRLYHYVREQQAAIEEQD